MKLLKLENWPTSLQDVDSLRLFAESWQEMLFDYTLDSYKAKIMNILSLSEEFSETFYLYKAGVLSAQSCIPIQEEILDAIDSDSIANRILGEHKNLVETTIKNWQPNCKNEREILSACSYIIDALTPKYFDFLKKEISALVVENKNKKDIIERSRELLTEVLRLGFSSQFVYYQTHKFFYGDQKINSCSQIDDFMKTFDISSAPRKFNVYLKLPRHAKYLAKDANPKLIEAVDKLPFDLKTDEERKIFECSTDHVLLCVKGIAARDEFSARRDAQAKIATLSSFVGFLFHKIKTFPISGCIVEDAAIPGRYQMPALPTSPTMKRPDIRPYNFRGSLRRLIRPFLVNDFSESVRERLSGALRAHLAGTRSKSQENQFLNLWTALETLVGSTTDKNTMETILSNSIPMLCLKYFLKILSALETDIRRCHPTWHKKYIISNSEGRSNVENLLLFLTDPKNAGIKKELIQMASKTPLLRARIHKISEQFTSKATMISLLNKHEQRIRWHLSRIYRVRNQLIHAGASNANLDLLIENLHSYVDHVLMSLATKLYESPSHTDFESVFYQYKIDYETYKKWAQEMQKKQAKPLIAQNFVFGIR